MIFAIPSKGRPNGVKSKKVLPSAIVFVPISEIRDYEKAGVTNLIGIPDEVRGITRTRNWILDNTQDSQIVFLDDDVKAQGWIQLEAEKAIHRKLTEEDWIRESAKLFDLTENFKFRIWGVATQDAPRSVYPWKPILTRSYVTASFMGIINDGRTRFNEDFPVKEDYELNLRCIKEDGGVIAARYLYWTNAHWADPGGCTAYRTQLMELRCIKQLINLYPGMIRQIKRGGSIYSIELEF